MENKRTKEEYNLENNLICSWNSTNEIYNVLHFFKYGIQRCCRGKTKSYQDFIWRYKL